MISGQTSSFLLQNDIVQIILLHLQEQLRSLKRSNHNVQPNSIQHGVVTFKLRVLNDRSPGDGWGLPILVGQIASKDDGDHVIVLLPHCETLHGHRTRAWVKVAVLEPAHWLLGFQGGDLSEGSWNDQADLHGQATEAPGLTWRGWSYTGRGLILFFPPANF